MKKKILFLIMILIIISLILIKIVNATDGYKTINSKTLFEKSELDSLVLNYNSLPTVTITGTHNYTLTDKTRYENVKIRELQFKNLVVGQTLDSTITVKYNNCGTLERKTHRY